MDLIGRFTPKVLAAAVALAVSAIAANANAAGLGRLTVQSALGQPLRAEVEITSLSKDEAASLTAKLAPPDAFKQAGLEYNPALTGLSFTIGQRADGRPVVKVTSSRPVNEPFVDLLVELNWASGKFVREYTFLLDPPELRIARPSGSETTAGGAVVAPAVQSPSAQVTATPAPQAAAPAPVVPAPVPAPTATAAIKPAASAEPKVAEAKEAGAPKTAKGKRAPKAAAPAETPAAETATTSSAPAGGVKTRRGDTLAVIASRNRPSGVSLDQAIVAIYRANPSAFFGSINKMRADAQLTIPAGSEMTALSEAEATKQVRDSGEFRSYRSRLASSSRKLTTAKASQSASGAVDAPQAAKPAGPVVRDELKLSKGAPSAKAGTGGAGSKTASAESEIARENALKESNSRVNELQKNVKDLEKLLELKNKRLAEVEKQLNDAKNVGKTASGAVTAPPVVVPKVDTAKADAAKADAAKADAAKAEAAKLEAAKADAAKAEMAKADAAKAAAEKVDAAKAAAAKADTAKTDAPKDVVASTPPMVAVPPPTDLKSVAPSATPTAPSAGDAPKVTEAPKPVPAPSVSRSPVTPAEPGIFDAITDNPLIPGGVIALLGLGGAYAWWRRRKKATSEDKFEDSLQAGEEFSANSLFGTTGGQQVDTSGLTAGAGSSSAATSMQHGQTSLSGPASTEVDPIAEAEVYIAYGREA
jgi:pilus assembly protein FimV